MKLINHLILMIVLIAAFSLQSGPIKENKTFQPENIIFSYIESKGLNISPNSIEFERMMKGILLGEYPDLTAKTSSYISSPVELDEVIDYAATHMNLESENNLGQFTEVTSEESNVNLSEHNRSNQIISSSLSHNRESAIEYAYTWTLQGGASRNPEYPDFGDEDCTNFISQAMNAGGFSKSGSGNGCQDEDTSTEWYSYPNPSPSIFCIGNYRNWEWSTSWSVPLQFRNYFFLQTHRASEIGWTLDPALAKYYLSPGDVIQLQAKNSSNEWITYHTMIVTSEDGSDLYVTYHSNADGTDEVDKPLSLIPTGSSQRYLLELILYPEIYLPIVINNNGNNQSQQQSIYQNSYPAPRMDGKSRTITPYPAP